MKVQRMSFWKTGIMLMSACLIISCNGNLQNIHEDRSLVSDTPVNNITTLHQNNSETKAGSTQSSESLKRTSWWLTVQKNIQEQEYYISHLKDPDKKNAHPIYQAPNRKQDLRTYFSTEGIQVIQRTEKNSSWSVDLKLHAIGREDNLRICQPDENPITNGPRIEYHRDSVIEWYVNRPNGIEQGFTIENKIDGSGNIKLHLAVHGNTNPKISDGGNAIDFISHDNIHVLRYGGLHVYDDLGNVLPSSFELANNTIIIRVDDTDATYPIIVDPLLSSPSWSQQSNQKYAHFGNSVRTAGDVNGDGYSDIIVGVPDFDSGTNDSQHLAYENGSVFVFHGSSTGLSTSADWTVSCDQTQARFGYAVGTAGDTNNDGYSDIIIGAPYYTNGETEEGAVFVFFGSATGLDPATTQADADWSVESGQANSRFGLSVGTAGDTDGDGYSDIIIGAPHFDNLSQSDYGKAFVYYGNATGFETTFWGFDRVGNSEGAHFGFSVSTAGDFNGDGYSDVIVGAPDYTNGQTNEGLGFLFLGSSGGVLSSYQLIQNNSTGANLGHSVGVAGDVNGDGYSDVIIGSPDSSAGGYGGRVDVIYGASSGNGGTWTLNYGSGAYIEINLGSSVGSAGDINGDGYADIIIGAHGYPSGGSTQQRDEVFVYYGSAGGLSPSATRSNADWSQVLSYPVDYFGVDSLSISVFSAGDVDGDGYSDVMVGDPFYDDGSTTEEGRVYVYEGSQDGLSESYGWLRSIQSGSNYGRIVGNAGDLNGDGYDEVFVCAKYYDSGQTNEGAAFIYHGSGAGLNTSPSWVGQGGQNNLEFGSTASSAGDVDGDGYDDFIVGDGDNNAYLYLGSSIGLGTGTAPGNANWTVSGFGGPEISVGNAGDVNGDGYSDIVIGATYAVNGHSNEGIIYVYHGSTSGLIANPLPSNADWRAEGNTVNLYFGYDVETAGDVNGDGFSDIIVGTKSGDKAYVFFGSSSGLDKNGSRSSGEPLNADWLGEGDPYEEYGYSVGSAGDVNGDGYSDIIVGEFGTPFITDTVYRRGKVYVYYGSSDGPSPSEDWTAEGGSNWEYFGYSVASAGDVNGDNYSDIIIGAGHFDTGNGEAFVYLGSAIGLGANGTTSNADWSATSGNWFGGCVSSAGDVNGDGFSDVIVGQYDLSQAFLYYGNNGNGSGVQLRQMQPGGTSRLALLGISDQEGAINLSANAKTPMGRSNVKLEWEAKPVEDNFDGLDTSITSTWQDTGVNGYLFNIPATGLVGHTNYHWRARLVYPAGNPLGQMHSRWFRPFPNNPEMLDFRTSNDPPTGGFTSDNVIPASQVNQSTNEAGIVEVNFRIKDGGINQCTLHTFQYSINGGSSWITPSNGDFSDLYSPGWTDNDGFLYSSSIDWTGMEHMFTFDTRNSAVETDFDGQDQNDVRIRFTVNDGLANSALPVTSENFSVDSLPPTTGTISIVDNSGTTIDATPDLNINSTGASHMRFALSEGNLSAASWVPYSTTYNSFDISSGGNGVKTIWVEYRDQYWNIQATHTSDSTTLDTSPIVGGDATTNDTTPTWTWSSSGDGSGLFRYKLDDSDLSAGATETNGTTYTPSQVLSEGLHILYVQEWNSSGYWGWTGSFTIEIDSGRPCSEASSPSVVDDINQTFTITYVYDDIYAGETCGDADSGSGLATVGLWVKAPADDTYSLADTDSDGDIDGQFSYTAGDQGAYDFYTIATDNAGNAELVTGSDTRTIFASEFSGYAILAVGAYGAEEEGLDSHTLTANNVYKHLINRNFALVDDEVDKWTDPLDYIKYYNPYGEIQTGEDDYTEGDTVSYWQAMQKAVSQWALNKMTVLPGPLYIILIDHGTENNFYLKHPSFFTATEMDGWLTTLEDGLDLAGVSEDIVIILGTCYSGSFIDELSKPGRIIVSSSAADEPSYRGPLEPSGIRDGEFFISSLFNELGRGENLKTSFLNAVERVDIHTDSGYANSAEPYFDAAMQHPYLDDDGLLPGSYNLIPGGDGDVAKDIILGYKTSAIDPVVVSDVVGLPDTIVANASHEALLWAKVSDIPNTDRVWVEIRDPGTTLEGGAEQQLVDLNEFSLTLNGDRYEATYTEFWTAGKYTLFFYAKDNSGLISPFKKSYVYKEQSGTNTPPDAFNLLTPADSSEVAVTTILDWEDTQDSTDGHSISYTLTISTNSDLSITADWVHREEGIQHSVLSIDESNGIQNQTTYYWQVTAVDEYGASTETAVWSFDTDNVSNPAFGWIMGYVYNDSNNDPIPYATVQFDILTLSTDASGYYIGVRPPGNYDLTITAPDFAQYGPASVQITEGGTLEKNITLTPSSVDTDPTASITLPATDVIINEGDAVNFIASVSNGNAPFTYAWNFDGGATNVAVQNPGSVTFNTAGTYTVTFTVTDTDSDTDNDTVTVTVNEVVIDLLPSATIDAPVSPPSILAGGSINFQGSATSGDMPLTYLWDFDGGATNSTQEDPGDVAFPTDGVYDVTFTVTDNDGDTDSDTVTVTITLTDGCLADPDKTDPGICGCGVPDTDTDDDSTPDCNDTDDDNDGILDVDDDFPLDDTETVDTDEDGTGDNADTDDDNDGISDIVEAAGPNSGDANNDGTQDSLQDNVACVASYTSQGYVVLETPPGITLSNCQVADNPSPGDDPADMNFDYGFFDFTISGITPGGGTTLTMTLPSGVTPDTYYKYGQTQANQTDHWYEFLYDMETGAEIDGNIITLNFVDALRGDDVLTQDSMVIDLGAPGFDTTAIDVEPTATISSPASNTTITAGESVNFQGSVTSGNAPFTYSWNFGGGASNVNSEDPGSVTFSTAGTYTVTFTVTDADNDTDSDTVSITVNSPDDGGGDGGGGGGGGGCFIEALFPKVI